jgi:hypothetical protein
MRSQERLRIEVLGYHTRGTGIVDPAPICSFHRERCTCVQHNDEDDEVEIERRSFSVSGSATEHTDRFGRSFICSALSSPPGTISFSSF